MITINQKQKLNSGWDNVFMANRVRSDAKRKRLKKVALYRNMVGSVRELRRKMADIETANLRGLS